MSSNCCQPEPMQCLDESRQKRYRKMLWLALVINATMFLVEIVSSLQAGSVALLADSVDFLGDAANYGLSLWVIGMSIHTRALASLTKAASMAGFGLWVIASTLWHWWQGGVPSATTMGAIATLALVANVFVAFLLYAYRNGDSNMRSVWLCTRNDAIGNIVVMLAALGVFSTGSAWPDLIVAGIMGTLALSSSLQLIRHARAELAS